MNLACNVVQDLLPLYHDGVCSEESKALVQEHIATCARCKNYLHNLKEENAPDQPESAKPLAAIGKAWKKSIKKALVKGLLIAFMICAVLFGGFVAVTQWQFIEVSAHAMSVSEIYQLQDGRIIYKLEVPDGVYCNDWKFAYTEDGSMYKIPVTALINTAQLQGFTSELDYYQIIDVGENNASRKAQGLPPVTKWYIGSPNLGSALLIYEEGITLEPAPAELEERYGSEPRNELG